MNPRHSSLLFACGLAAASAAEPASPPPLEVLPGDILSSRTTHDGQRSVTVQQIDPAVMDDLRPVPEPAGPASFDEEPQPEEAAEPEDSRPVVFSSFGASVFIPDRAHPEKAFTRLQKWHPDGNVVFWIPINFLWLSGHGEFATETTRHQMLLAISEGGIDSEEIPAFPADPTVPYLIEGEQPTAADTAAVQTMLDFYHANTQVLRTQYEERLAQAAAAEAARLADPPEKKNIVLRYWRTDAAGIQTAREKGGGQ